MRRLLIAVLGSLLAVALIAQVAQGATQRPATARADALATPGELLALSESAVFDSATGQVMFTLTFNRPPDFQTVDPNGRLADSFQYYIVGLPSLPYPYNYDTIIRQEEPGPQVLQVRNARPSAPLTPTSGGWGTVRGVVPYGLNGNVVTFSTSLGLISDHSVNGHFSYDLQIGQYGAETQFFRGLESVVDPRCKDKPATIIGTNGNDQLSGTPAADVIAALDGNDKVRGLAGNDVICGGAGNDTLKGGKGNDKLYGESGKDTLKGGPGKDILKGGPGKDKKVP